MLETVKKYGVGIIDGDILDEFDTVEDAEKFKGDNINYEIIEFEYYIEYIVLSDRIENPELHFKSTDKKFNSLEEAREYAGYDQQIYQAFYATDSGDLAWYWEV